MKHALLIFISTFSYYIYGLAPTVTLEDSGELIVAVYHLGVPHPPGYPLYTMIAHLFTYLPFGDVAYRVNLMSAFFSALAIAVLYFAICEVLKVLSIKKEKWIALLVAVSIAVLPHFFRQAVITEVYGLNNFLCASLLFLSLRWWRLFRKGDENEKKLFYLYAFVSGLVLTNHHTSWVFAFCGLVFVAISLKGKLISRLPFVLVVWVLGLIPYIYLPLASLSNPILDWGNPKTWSAFFDVVTRKQYEPSLWRSSYQLTEQLREYVILLIGQIKLPLLFLGIFGLIASFRQRYLGSFLILLLILTGPITSLLVNYKIQFFNQFLNENTHEMFSVFFLSHYLVWGVVISIGVGEAIEMFGQRKKQASIVLAALLSLLFVFSCHQTLKKESKRHYYYAEQLMRNTLKLADGRKSILLTRWDPFTFPFMYYQFVEHKAKNLVIIDTEMLKAQWYINALKRWYPELYLAVEEEMKALHEVLGQFFAGGADGATVMKKYHELLDQIIDKHLDNTPIFLAHYRGHSGLPMQERSHYHVQSQYVLGRLTRKGSEIKTPEIAEFDFSRFPIQSDDIWASMLASYYGGLIIDRGQAIEKDHPEKAEKLYQKARSIAIKDMQIQNWLNKKLEPESK